jgi:uncharacterized membrane protein YbhN (UPF0104 family)
VSKPWRLLGSLVFLGILAWRLDWVQLASAFAHLNLTLWGAALALYLATQVVSSLRWQLLAGGLGFSGWWGQYLAYYFIGMFFNLLLPTSVGGDVVRAWYLAGQPQSTTGPGPRLGAFLSVFADRVSGLAVLVALACVATLFCPTALPAWIVWLVGSAGAGVVIGLACLPLLPRIQQAFPHSVRLKRLLEATTVYLSQGRLMLTATLLSVVVQVANVILVWLIGEALGLPIPPLYYGVLVPLVTLLTLAPISLNGMGLREAGTVLLLAPLGVSTASAVTLSLLTFAVFTAASLGGLGFYLVGRFPRVVVTSEDASTNPALADMEVRSHDDPFRGDPHQGRTRQPSTAA